MNSLIKSNLYNYTDTEDHQMKLPYNGYVLRLLFLIIGGSFGGYGIILTSVVLLTYLSSFESFTVPYLSPYSPLILNDLQDGLTLDFLANMKRRPLSFRSPNKIRKGNVNE